MKKKKRTTVLLVILFLLGFGIMLYPTVSDYYNSFHSSRVISSYSEEVAHIDTATYERLWNQAVEYNRSLAEQVNPFYITEEQRKAYLSALNVSEDGMMGYIEIPKIHCELPIYHTTEESVLQVAVGHIEGTSLPVGGESTHCALSGHRGLPSAKLFTNLDRMEEGDVFMLQILDETLAYEVDQIRIVEPDEVKDIHIEEGKDYCTLVTCTPYGINSHRLLVRGHRVDSSGMLGVRITADAMRIEPILVASAIAIPLLLMLLLWLFTGGKPKAAEHSKSSDKKKERKKRKGGMTDETQEKKV